ncbi:MAG: Error-prone repair protein ImuA [Ferruginibacter sp.]
MAAKKKDLIAQLQKKILPLQGCKLIVNGIAVDTGLGIINHAFSNAIFPLGAVHEFIAEGAEDTAATTGFIGGVLGSLMQNGGAAIWISGSKTIFPPALQSFGIAPDKIIFIDLHKEKEMLWAMEEALKCEGLAAVIGEIPDISFTTSRRLQLAVEQSQVTGFILRCKPRNLNTTACVTRWKITHLPTELPAGMPGVGFPRWNVDLLKVRNGKPGSWQMEFVAGRFRQTTRLTVVHQDQQKKAG